MFNKIKDLLQNKSYVQNVMIFVPNKSKPTKRNNGYVAKVLVLFRAKIACYGLRGYFARGLKHFFDHKDKYSRDNTKIFIVILVGTILSLMSAFILSIDALEIAKNPGVILNCSINAIINCATVAKSSFAEIFGFPNSFIGLISQPIFITIAIAGLFGVKFPRLFMFYAQIIYTFAFIFAYYLFFIGLFIIQAVCPWCLVVTLSTTVVFFFLTRYNIREDNLYLSKRFAKKAKTFIDKDYDKLVLALMIFSVFAILITKYGTDLFA